jgi:basic membrane lipoprotein Med (substrate-binding protein (PBP1-ABC) superfamily)
MKTLQKLFAILLVLLLCFGITACSENAPEVTTVPPAKLLGPPVIGAVFSGLCDQQYTYSYDHYKDLLQALGTTGYNYKTQLFVAENIAPEETALREAVATLIEQGANVIFCTDFGYSPYMLELAEEYSHIVFCQMGGTERNGQNLVDYFGEIYKSYYIAGRSAGKKALEEGITSIGFVSAYGMENPDAVAAVNAFLLGVRYYVGDATVYLKVLPNSNDEMMESVAAELLVDEYDCGILAQYTNTSATLTTAKYLGVPACGPYFYANDLAPDTVLETPHFNWFKFYREAIMAAEKCTYAADFGKQLGTDRYYPQGVGIGLGHIASLTEETEEELSHEVKSLLEHRFPSKVITDESDPFYNEADVLRLDRLFSGRFEVCYNENGSMIYPKDLVDNQGNVIIPADGVGMSVDRVRSMDFYLEGIVVVTDG